MRGLLIQLLTYGGLFLASYSLHSTTVLGAMSYQAISTQREDIRKIIITQPMIHPLTYTRFECITSPQPYTPIPSMMVSAGLGYRHHITPDALIGGYLVCDYGIDKFHTVNTALLSWLAPMQQSSLAAAYLLKNIPLAYHSNPMPQETQFVNLNIGVEYSKANLSAQSNLYIPLFSKTDTSKTQHPFYIEESHYGMDTQWAYILNNTLSPFAGGYLFYQSTQSNMIGLACGVTAHPLAYLTIDIKYSIDSLRGQAWSIVCNAQLNRWLKFFYKYTYDREQGHTTTPAGFRGLLFGLQWRFDSVSQPNKPILIGPRHLSPVMLRVPGGVTKE